MLMMTLTITLHTHTAFGFEEIRTAFGVSPLDANSFTDERKKAPTLTHHSSPVSAYAIFFFRFFMRTTLDPLGPRHGAHHSLKSSSSSSSSSGWYGVSAIEHIYYLQFTVSRHGHSSSTFWLFTTTLGKYLECGSNIQWTSISFIKNNATANTATNTL